MNAKAPCFIKDEGESYVYLILPVNFSGAVQEFREDKNYGDNQTQRRIYQAWPGTEGGRSCRIRCGSKGSHYRSLVKVNGEVDTRRGKKLYDGDVVTFNGEEIKIEKQAGAGMISNH